MQMKSSAKQIRAPPRAPRRPDTPPRPADRHGALPKRRQMVVDCRARTRVLRRHRESRRILPAIIMRQMGRFGYGMICAGRVGGRGGKRPVAGAQRSAVATGMIGNAQGHARRAGAAENQLTRRRSRPDGTTSVTGAGSEGSARRRACASNTPSRTAPAKTANGRLSVLKAGAPSPRRSRPRHVHP